MRITGMPAGYLVGIPTSQTNSGLITCLAGVYTQIFAATPGNSLWANATVHPTGAAAHLVSFYIGAIGSEVFQFRFTVQRTAGNEYYIHPFPFRIPKNSRIIVNPDKNCDVSVAYFY